MCMLRQPGTSPQHTWHLLVTPSQLFGGGQMQLFAPQVPPMEHAVCARNHRMADWVCTTQTCQAAKRAPLRK